MTPAVHSPEYFLKVLGELSILKGILREMFARYRFFDLIVTIASIAAVFLTGGASVIARLTLSPVDLLVSLVGAGIAHTKLQEGT